jgi:hypothetical protein
MLPEALPEVEAAPSVPVGDPPLPMAIPSDPGAIGPVPEEAPPGAMDVPSVDEESSLVEDREPLFTGAPEGLVRVEPRSRAVDGRGPEAFSSRRVIACRGDAGMMRRSTSAYCGADQERGLGLGGNTNTYSHRMTE